MFPPVGKDPGRQFARTPYFAGFTRAGTEFTLAAVHVLWGRNAAERLPEVTASPTGCGNGRTGTTTGTTTSWSWATSTWTVSGNPLYEAFINTGLWPPTELNKVPRIIFNDDNVNHFHDQIAWSSEPDGTPLLQDITYTQQAGSFDFIPYTMTGLTRTEISLRISDHYPLWTEFRVSASN